MKHDTKIEWLADLSNPQMSNEEFQDTEHDLGMEFFEDFSDTRLDGDVNQRLFDLMNKMLKEEQQEVSEEQQEVSEDEEIEEDDKFIKFKKDDADYFVDCVDLEKN